MSGGERDIVFKEYKECEGAMINAFSGDKLKITCDSFSTGVQKFGNERANDVCVKFKILCKVIQSKKKNPNTENLNDIDFAYLNYWLNSLSRNTTINHDLTVDQFQKEMIEREYEFVSATFDKKLYDLDDEDFNNMNLLSELQTNYGEIFRNSATILEGNIPCIEHFQKCIDIYKKCIIKCPHDGTSFCKALNHFKEGYNEKIFGTYGLSEKCPDKEFIKLPTYNDVLQENQKITTIGTILGPSFASLFTSVFFYKFTPLGQWIRGKMGTKIGTHSNLYEENNQLSLNTSDNENINFDEVPYRISYDSVANY